MSVRKRAANSKRSTTWLAVALIFGGLFVIWQFLMKPQLSASQNAFFAILYLGTGGSMIAWGLRSLFIGLYSSVQRLRRRNLYQYSVRMPREAVVYGLILMVLCAGALMGGSNMLMLVFGLMAGPFVLNGQMTLGVLRRLSVFRRLPQHAAVGERLRVQLALSNKKWWLASWMVMVEDTVQSNEEIMSPMVLFACVPRRSTRDGYYEIVPAQRGLYEFGPVRAISRFPLGLMERSIEMGMVETLVVYPRIGRMLPTWRSLHSAATASRDAMSAAVGMHNEEFQSLREYRDGDSPRAIHWRTTARRNQLMVREYEHARHDDLLLVVDLHLPERATAEDRQQVEMAVSLAASICVDQLQFASDAVIDLVVCGRETVRAAYTSGPAALTQLLELLATAAGGAASDLVAAAKNAVDDSWNGKRSVLVTTRAARESGDWSAGDAFVRDYGRFEVYHVTAETMGQLVEYPDSAVEKDG